MPTHHTKSRKSRKSLTKRKSRISKKTKLSKKTKHTKKTKLSKRSKANKKGGGNPPNPNFNIKTIKEFVIDAINKVEPDSGLRNIKKTEGNEIIYFIFDNKENAEKFRLKYGSTTAKNLYLRTKDNFLEFIINFIPHNEYGFEHRRTIYNVLTYGSNIEVLTNLEYETITNPRPVMPTTSMRGTHRRPKAAAARMNSNSSDSDSDSVDEEAAADIARKAVAARPAKAAMGQPPADMPDFPRDAEAGCPNQQCKQFIPDPENPRICRYCGCSQGAHPTSFGINTIEKNLFYLRSCYDPGYEFPVSRVRIDHMEKCKVFYNSEDFNLLEDIKRLVYQREPVNIEMKRHYDKNKLKKHFGYEYGYYATCPKSFNKLNPPNILVYTPTHIVTPGIHQYKVVHILNVIGLAFDDETQQDYIEYGLSADKRGNQQQYDSLAADVTNFYVKLFNNIYNVAKKLDKKTIIMSLVGANNFAKKWPSGNAASVDYFQKYIWVPAYKESKLFYPDKIDIKFMGSRGSRANKLLNIQNNDIGRFPNDINKAGKLNDALFINAWDCWSVPGNGNASDISLDGFIGRNTQIGINGTSLTNPYLDLDKNYVSI